LTAAKSDQRLAGNPLEKPRIRKTGLNPEGGSTRSFIYALVKARDFA
jgi:hypothetical protein